MRIRSEKQRKKWLAKLREKKTKAERYVFGIHTPRRKKTEQEKKNISDAMKIAVHKAIATKKRMRYKKIMDMIRSMPKKKGHPHTEESKSNISEGMKKFYARKKGAQEKGSENNGLDKSSSQMYIS